jgi:hypothetical protein
LVDHVEECEMDGEEEKGSMYRCAGGGTVTKGPLVRPRHRCEYSIQMDVKEIGSEDVE